MASKSYLFKLTHLLLIAGALLMLLVTLLLAIGEGALLIGYFIDPNHLGIPAVMHEADMPAAGITRDTIFGVGIPLVAVMAAGVLMFAAIFHLAAKIVESAILGDPFVGENATRLSWIGWLLLAVQAGGTICALLLQLVFPNLPHVGGGHQPRIGDVQLDLGPQLSFVGLLAVLLIFVLAQVFRRGSEMRDELEATV